MLRCSLFQRYSHSSVGDPQSLQQHPHGHFDPNVEYKVKSIIKEQGGRYLISWEDVDGQSFPDSWEPKANANKQAVDDWHAQKKQSAPPDMYMCHRGC